MTFQPAHEWYCTNNCVRVCPIIFTRTTRTTVGDRVSFRRAHGLAIILTAKISLVEGDMRAPPITLTLAGVAAAEMKHLATGRLAYFFVWMLMLYL